MLFTPSIDNNQISSHHLVFCKQAHSWKNIEFLSLQILLQPTFFAKARLYLWMYFKRNQVFMLNEMKIGFFSSCLTSLMPAGYVFSMLLKKAFLFFFHVFWAQSYKLHHLTISVDVQSLSEIWRATGANQKTWEENKLNYMGSKPA